MNKINMITLVLLVGSLAQAGAGFDCYSSNGSSEESLTVSAKSQSANNLRDVKLSWTHFEQKTQVRLPIVSRNENYKPRSPKYAKLQQFPVKTPNTSDCTWSLIFPTVSGRNDVSFYAYAQVACDSYFKTLKLSCDEESSDE